MFFAFHEFAGNSQILTAFQLAATLVDHQAHWHGLCVPLLTTTPDLQTLQWRRKIATHSSAPVGCRCEHFFHSFPGENYHDATS